MAAKVIAFANHKGGVGKTASTVNVAYCLAKRKRRVLVVDCDPQGNASLTLGTVSPYEQPRTVANLFTGLSFSAAAVPSKYEGLDLIPANLNVYATVSTLSNSIKRFFGFRQALDLSLIHIYGPPVLGNIAQSPVKDPNVGPVPPEHPIGDFIAVSDGHRLID